MANHTQTIFNRQNTNDLPNYYITNYPQKIVHEFKRSVTIGLSTTDYVYADLTTYVSWNDNSVSLVQIAYAGEKIYRRISAVRENTWGAWQKIATEDDLQTCIKKVEYINWTSGAEKSVINPASNRPQVVMLCGNSGSGDVQTYAFGIRTVNPNAVQRNKNYITWIKAPPSNIVFTLSDTDLTKIKIDYTGTYSLHLYLWT